MFPIQIQLRDDREITLRRVCAGDALELMALERAIVHAGLGVVKLPGELWDDLEEQTEHAQWWVDHPDSLQLVARGLQPGHAEPRIFGCIDIRRIPWQMMRHNAALTMGVHPDWQGAGMGRALLQHALRWAAQTDIARIELSTLADNIRAQRLYQSEGFVHCHRRRDFLRRPDGSSCDDLVMEWRSA